MTKRYHGKNILPTIIPESAEEALIIVQTAPQNINFILKIIESHNHLTIPVQIDPTQGILGFHTPKDQQELLRQILLSIPRSKEFLN